MQMMSRRNHAKFVPVLATLLVSAAAVSAQVTAPVARAAGTGRAHLLSCSGHTLVRPRGTVVLACGDGNIVISHTQWSSWTKSSASGTTDLDINLCDPTCVQSKMRTFTDSTVHLSDVERTHSGLVFTRATITFNNAGKRTTVSAYPRT
jgi:hypothetical protein